MAIRFIPGLHFFFVGKPGNVDYVPAQNLPVIQMTAIYRDLVVVMDLVSGQKTEYARRFPNSRLEKAIWTLPHNSTYLSICEKESILTQMKSENAESGPFRQDPQECAIFTEGGALKIVYWESGKLVMMDEIHACKRAIWMPVPESQVLCGPVYVERRALFFLIHDSIGNKASVLLAELDEGYEKIASAKQYPLEMSTADNSSRNEYLGVTKREGAYIGAFSLGEYGGLFRLKMDDPDTTSVQFRPLQGNVQGLSPGGGWVVVNENMCRIHPISLEIMEKVAMRFNVQSHANMGDWVFENGNMVGTWSGDDRYWFFAVYDWPIRSVAYVYDIQQKCIVAKRILRDIDYEKPVQLRVALLK